MQITRALWGQLLASARRLAPQVCLGCPNGEVQLVIGIEQIEPHVVRRFRVVRMLESRCASHRQLHLLQVVPFVIICHIQTFSSSFWRTRKRAEHLQHAPLAMASTPSDFSSLVPCDVSPPLSATSVLVLPLCPVSLTALIPRPPALIPFGAPGQIHVAAHLGARNGDGDAV